MTDLDMAGLTHIGQTFAFISPSNWFVIPSLFNAKARCRTVSVFPQPAVTVQLNSPGDIVGSYNAILQQV